jgi:hypothetical protein
MLATHPQSVTHFRDDDRGFFGWLEHNPDGYFINSGATQNRPTSYCMAPTVRISPEVPTSTGRRTTSSSARPTAESWKSGYSAQSAAKPGSAEPASNQQGD